MMQVMYRGANSNRGPSPNLWADCPVMEILKDPNLGVYYFNDFLDFTPVAAGAEAQYGTLKGFASTGGSVAVADEIGGAVTFSSDGDNEGASIATNSKPFQISASHGKLWMEFRVKFSSAADSNSGGFLGLIDTSTLSATVPIAADGTLADENLVGFHRLEGDGDAIDFVYKADGVTAVTKIADAGTVAAATHLKVGMKFEPANGNLLTAYINGVAHATTYTMATAAGTDFPNDVRLGLVAAILNATGSSPGTMTLDWMRCAQLFV